MAYPLRCTPPCRIISQALHDTHHVTPDCAPPHGPDEIAAMYYDDQARRFNVLSGLIFGTVLGAGLALLLTPQKEVRRPVRRAARGLRRRSGRAVGRVRDGVMETLAEGLSDAWKRRTSGAR